MPQTLFDKIWQNHAVSSLSDGRTLLYIDRHLVHEVTSPQAFEGLRLAQRPVRRPDLTFATLDHNIPTDNPHDIQDQIARLQVETLRQNCQDFGVTLFDLDSDKQGIVHVMGPELGLTLPGTTIVCGDSHTSTHGAFGALAFGIGTSEVEHVLATQCLPVLKPQNFRVAFEGQVPQGVSAKDLILYLIGQMGTAGGTGHVLEYTGSAITSLSMEARLSLCNMSIEAGARAGLIAPDDTTFSYLAKPERLFAPQADHFDQALVVWKSLVSDPEAVFDKTLSLSVSGLAPQVTWGTHPGMVTGIDAVVPAPGETSDSPQDVERALSYMDLQPGQKITDIEIDVAFIGSCTNARLEDLREAARFFKNQKVHSRVTTYVVPGSQQVKKQAEKEGLHHIFQEAGAQWREPGCSMCLAMNPDRLQPGQRCASTSNRNFEGRQGSGGRTHLVSPAMAAAASIQGHFVDVRDFQNA